MNLKQYLIKILVVIWSSFVPLCCSYLWSEDDNCYKCHHLDKFEKINIDGIMDDPAWGKAKPLEFFIPVSNHPSLSKSKGRLVWDDAFIYVFIKGFDKDIKSFRTTRDSQTYKDDCLEIFFMDTDSTQSAEKANCYNFEINALGTVLDAYHPNPLLFKEYKDENDSKVSGWNCEEMKIAIKIEGTLNDDSDEDNFWTIEVAIPFSSLPSQKYRSSARYNEKWVFLLSRYDYSKYLPEGKELSSISKLSKIKFHNYDEWMKLMFCK